MMGSFDIVDYNLTATNQNRCVQNIPVFLLGGCSDKVNIYVHLDVKTEQNSNDK